MTLIYNLVMLAVDAAALRLFSRHRGLLAWCGIMLAAGAVAVLLGGVLGKCFENGFGAIRLWAYGVFCHAVVLLAVTAIIWRRQHRALACGAAIGAVALALIAADAFLVEPHWLEVSHWRIASPKIRRPVRIVVVADLQTDDFGAYEREVLRRVLAEKPDVILLAGDYLDARPGEEESLQGQLRDFLREIQFAAPRGVFAVKGNVERSDWHKIFEGLGITMVDSFQSFDLGDIRLTCLGLAESFDAGLTVTNAGPDQFHVVLGHVPDFALGQVEADLLVAGHTHGGQVRFPGIGPAFVLCRIPRAWAAGLTELPGARKLLVSRGIGMERGYAPRLRFLCRPELMVIDLVKE